jgi:hypothetical protein
MENRQLKKTAIKQLSKGCVQIKLKHDYTLTTGFILCRNIQIKQKLLVSLFALSILVTGSSAQTYTEQLYLKTTQYNLEVKVDFENRKIIADCGITVMNTSAEECKIIPLLLYRLMKV